MLDKMKTAADHGYMVPAGNSSLVDRAAAKRLESLGYVAGPVRRPISTPTAKTPRTSAPWRRGSTRPTNSIAPVNWRTRNRRPWKSSPCVPIWSPSTSSWARSPTSRSGPNEVLQWLSKALSTLTEGREEIEDLADGRGES